MPGAYEATSAPGVGLVILDGMPATTSPRTRSGTVVALTFVGLCVALVLFILIVAPSLREQVLASGGISERDTIASGADWEIVATREDEVACVLVEAGGDERSRVCTEDEPDVLAAPVATAVDVEPRWFLTGFAARDVPLVRVELSDGQERVIRTRGAESGYPATFWATLVEPGVDVDRIVAIDNIDTPLGELACPDGPLLTAAGETC